MDEGVGMKKTLKSLQEEIANLKKTGKDFADAVYKREVSRPYHYETNPEGATSAQTPIAKVAELFAHVQRPTKLGCETMLEADDKGRLQVVFLKKLPAKPFEFLY